MKTVADLTFWNSIIGFVLGVLSLTSCAQERSDVQNCTAPNHDSWTVLLQKNVDENGWVSYNQFVKDSVLLNEYLNRLSSCPPNQNWTESEKLAYWINAYNAFTIKLIVNNYPINSIKDIKKGIPFINSVWELNFFEIGGKSFDLSTVEHQILRKEFDEPRIHFAIVCASKSCPQLMNEAFSSEKLEEQLSFQTQRFLTDSSKNELGKDKVKISPIFKWFKKDFTKIGTLQEFVSTHSGVSISNKTKIEYKSYDWTLNGE